MDVTPLRYGCDTSEIYFQIKFLSYHICCHLKWFRMSVLTLRKPSEMVLNVFKMVAK